MEDIYIDEDGHYAYKEETLRITRAKLEAALALCGDAADLLREIDREWADPEQIQPMIERLKAASEGRNSDVDSQLKAARGMAELLKFVEQHYNDGCLWCGYKQHKSTCSLQAALTAWRETSTPNDNCEGSA
jgi:hypothetical protein